MTITTPKRIGAFALVAALAIGACSSGGSSAAPSSAESQAPAASGSAEPSSAAPALSGTVTIDGSSTVYPITEAVAEEFQIANNGVQVPTAFSGTGGGFKKFCAGETDINDASRPIKADDEGEGMACTTNGIEFVELQVAIDGLTVVVNPANTFATCLTVEELAKIYGPDSPREPHVERRPRRLPGPAGQPVHAGRRLGHVRLLHRGDQRRGRRGDPARDPVRGRQHARDRRRGRPERDQLLRVRLLRREPGQAQGGRGRWRQRLRRADRGDDQRRHLHPAQPPAVHLPRRRQGEGAPRAQGLRRLLPREHERAVRGGRLHRAAGRPPDRRDGGVGQPPSAADRARNLLLPADAGPARKDRHPRSLVTGRLP